VKVAILTRDFPPKHLGGTEIATYNLAKELSKKGHQVLIVTTWDKELPAETIECGFRIRRVRFSRSKILKYPGLILFSIETLLILRKFQPDVIHGQSVYMGLPALLTKKVIDKPYVIWLRGSDIYIIGLSQFSNVLLPRWFRCSISKLFLDQADAVIALTRDMKEEAQKLCNTEVFVIPNGIDLKKFSRLSKKKARDRLHMQKDAKVLIFIGRLHKVKGIVHLIEAMKIIKEKCSKIQLLIIGDGTERDYLKRRVRDLNLEKYINFVGRVSNNSIPDYLYASDLFVLPSFSEGFPVTILEAMASGLPILATRVRGVPEIINEGVNGFLVEPGDSHQIAEKAILILQNDNMRDRISEHNKKYVKRYEWKNIIGKLEEAYSTIL
jgi:N-acetyl-alpha-D-glucosaminyl L-malate synthase BshA